ncbi:hypothetical protein NDU88_005428 [Pleurodeles waltl]|uniref:CCHC-type domain-containing protein n=1 Tax=Pleurodeles waltl TaxID=8319 RepID=A0AAV7WY89_PLEWA|nr:hypothetical protein NDU88_005428 [Pleurodeles waltl]
MRWEVKDRTGPKLDRDLFLDKVIKPEGIPGEEVLSCQTSASGWIFLLSFITHTLYRKYWEFFQGKKGEKPFNSFNILTGWEPASTEKRITVEMTNPHIPDRDIASLLQRYGTIAKGPTKVRDKRGMWNTTWQAIINLHKDPAGRDGLRHPPASFYLGADEGRICYPGQPFTCRKCQAVGHKGMDCPEKYCRICRQTGHEASRCTGKKVCNLCGGEGHTYYQCPKSDRPRTYAAAAAGTSAQKTTRPKLDPTANAKVNALLNASREEAQKIPEPTWRSNSKGLARRTTNPQNEKREPTVEPTPATDPAPPLETAVSVEPAHTEGTPEKGAPTDAPPPEAQGEPEQTPETGAKEGKESMAAARTPTPTQAPAKAKKKNKHPKKKVDGSSGDEEEIEKA